MILLQRDLARPSAVETCKAQVLICFKALNALRDFEDLTDLRPFLDQVEDDLRGQLGPQYQGLSRVLLFHRAGEAAVVQDVARRMMPGGTLMAYAQPGCWMQLGQDLGRLQAFARKAEPGYVDQAFRDLRIGDLGRVGMG